MLIEMIDGRRRDFVPSKVQQRRVRRHTKPSFGGNADEGRITGCSAYFDLDRIIAGRQIRQHDVGLGQADRTGGQAGEQCDVQPV